MRIPVTVVPHRFTTMIRCAALAAILCIGLAEPIFAQASAPAPPAPPPAAPPAFTDLPGLPVDEPQSTRITALIEAVNSCDHAKVVRFVEDNLTPRFREQIPDRHHVHVLLGMGRQSGGFDLHGLRTYDPPRPPTNRTVIVHSRLLDSWDGLIIEFEPEAPHRIDSLSLIPARPPVGVAAVSTAPLTLEQAAEQLKAFLERLAKADVFSGSALIAKDGKVIFTFVSGEASKAFAAPNNLDTKFNLGSMNKMFTAVGIAQLVEAGRLSFDDPISKYLGEDWLASEDARDKITIAQLLSHTSGLGSHFTDEFWRTSRDRFRSLDDFKSLIVNQTPAFEPGTRWAYSNSGFLLLGAIIEKVSGESYDGYIATHILGPAGMTGTGCFDMDIDTPNLAIGYSYEPGPVGGGQPRWVNNIFKHVIKGGSAGGGLSTAPDLLRFDQALRGGRLVSSEMLNTLWTPKPASPAYGYGFQLDGGPNNAGGRIAGHGGGFPGISSVLDMHLDTGMTFIAMCNYDDAAVLANRKCRELLARVK
jgi:CubicO group peptidase (beta-lactamase class C family)